MTVVTAASLESRRNNLPGMLPKKEVAVLKVVVLALALAVAFLAQTKFPPPWTATCVDAECIVGP